jgi:hypothetical protein
MAKTPVAPVNTSTLRRPAVAVEAKDVVLGETYTDGVTGIKGVAIVIYLSLSGCDQVSLQYVVEGSVKHLTVDAVFLTELQTKDEEPVAPRPGSSLNRLTAR